MGVPAKSRFNASHAVLPRFFAVLMNEMNVANSLAPSSVRKHPLTFSFTFEGRRSRSAWLLSKGASKERKNRQTESLSRAMRSTKAFAFPLALRPRFPSAAPMGGCSMRPTPLVLPIREPAIMHGNATVARQHLPLVHASLPTRGACRQAGCAGRGRGVQILELPACPNARLVKVHNRASQDLLPQVVHGCLQLGGACFFGPSEEGGLLLFELLARICAASAATVSSSSAILAACRSMMASRFAISAVAHSMRRVFSACKDSTIVSSSRFVINHTPLLFIIYIVDGRKILSGDRV